MSEKLTPQQFIFRQDVESHHYPITVVNCLDSILLPTGYKRLRATKDSEQFIWQNRLGERVIVDYYTEVNSLTYSRPFLPTEGQTPIPQVLENGYRNLQDLIAKLVQKLGHPYLAVKRQLLFAIEGDTAPEKLQELIPHVQRLLEQEENVRVEVNLLEATPKSALALLTPFGADD